MNFNEDVKSAAPLYYVKFDAKTNAPSYTNRSRWNDI